MMRHLVVGFDGSQPATQAVMWAAAEAERTGAPLKVVACYSPRGIMDPWFVGIPGSIDDVKEETVGELRTMVERAKAKHPNVTFEQKAVFGSARTALVKEAGGNDLLIVGTTGAGAVESWLLGSVAHAVAQSSTCPVVMVPNSAPVAPVGRIVIGIDDSASANLALGWATDEADARGGELVVVHAWQYEYPRESTSAVGRDILRVDAALRLERAVARSRERGHGPVRGELVEGPPVEVLLKHAIDADLVVVGSRGRGGFRSALFSSVAHGVAEHSPCPTVIVRAGADR